MSSTYPSSNHATSGSVNESASASSNASSSVFTAAEQQALSTSRIAAYVADTTASHIQHRHRSVEQSVTSHTANMRAYLDAFDATLATFEK